MVFFFKSWKHNKHLSYIEKDHEPRRAFSWGICTPLTRGLCFLTCHRFEPQRSSRHCSVWSFTGKAKDKATFLPSACHVNNQNTISDSYLPLPSPFCLATVCLFLTLHNTSLMSVCSQWIRRPGCLCTRVLRGHSRSMSPCAGVWCPESDPTAL